MTTLLSLLFVLIVAPSTPVRSTFDRFKNLAGDWTATSTKGWTERMRYQVIAAGSAIVETSIDAHPNETMTTVFHLDGERLLLTHYCVAGNQPRLAATSFDDGGKRVTFTFVDATNLTSRNQGHMDKAVFVFTDDGHFGSQWTWYENGKEQWMEDVKATRVRESVR